MMIKVWKWDYDYHEWKEDPILIEVEGLLIKNDGISYFVNGQERFLDINWGTRITIGDVENGL